MILGLSAQTELALALAALLLTKHFICDFALQTNWQALNKGVYGHPGGLAHAGGHGAASWLILLALGAPASLAIGVAATETLFHYHVDWAKARLTDTLGWTPQDRGFWIALGADQFVHALTYVVMTAYVLVALA